MAQSTAKSELKPVTTPITKESSRFVAHEKPMSPKGATISKVPSSHTSKVGIHGNEIIGEGQYLNFDKTIINRSVAGEIPAGFPKHQIGQSKEEYILVMKKWGAEHPELFKPESKYLDYDKTIKSMTINGQIPNEFPKYNNKLTRKQYVALMKNWSKQNIQLFKSEYWSVINK